MCSSPSSISFGALRRKGLNGEIRRDQDRVSTPVTHALLCCSVIRPFQVELVTQLLVELEWRVTHTRCETKSKIWGVVEPVRVWLAKVVSLMQLEEQAVHQKDNRMGYGSRRNAANDVEHLATRLEQLLR